MTPSNDLLELKNRIDKAEERVAIFYIDESWLNLEGKKHLILGGITTQDTCETALKVVKLKEIFGLGPFDEVKWNMKSLTQEQRNKLSVGIIGILTADCTALISIVEGEDRQKASEVMGLQVFDFCNQRHIPAFILYLDQGLVPKLEIFEEFLRTKLPIGSKFIGIQSLVSSKDQIIQCCDIFVGLCRLAILHELNKINKIIRVYDEEFKEGIGWHLKDFILLSTRYLLWGKTSLEEFERKGMPYKRSMNLGFRLESTISKETQHILEEKIATVYMGCMH